MLSSYIISKLKIEYINGLILHLLFCSLLLFSFCYTTESSIKVKKHVFLNFCIPSGLLHCGGSVNQKGKKEGRRDWREREGERKEGLVTLESNLLCGSQLDVRLIKEAF